VLPLSQVKADSPTKTRRQWGQRGLCRQNAGSAVLWAALLVACNVAVFCANLFTVLSLDHQNTHGASVMGLPLVNSNRPTTRTELYTLPANDSSRTSMPGSAVVRAAAATDMTIVASRGGGREEGHSGGGLSVGGDDSTVGGNSSGSHQALLGAELSPDRTRGKGALDQRPVYFLHVYKSGGTSFCSTARGAGKHVPPGANCNLERGLGAKPPSVQLARVTQFDVAANEYDGLPVLESMLMPLEKVAYVVCVRDPLDRFLSHFSAAQVFSKVRHFQG